MTSPGRGISRVLRGSLLAACCALLAMAGHVAGGGRATAVLPMLAGATPLAAGFSVWADRRRGPVEIVSAAVGSQVAFHVLLSLCGSTPATHDHRVREAMLFGHAVAAALTGWALACGESAVWALYHAMREIRSVIVVRLPVISHRPGGRRPAQTAPACGAGIVVAAAHWRRGPPHLGVVHLTAAR